LLQLKRERRRIDVRELSVEHCLAQTSVVLEELIFNDGQRQNRLRLKVEHERIAKK
jgi:hypothetical protein